MAENTSPEKTFSDKVALKLTGGYSIDDLEKVFNAVCNPDDWKAPILASVPGELVLITVKAIEFYTATVPTVALCLETMEYIISSEGYRNGPAGDH